MDQPVGLTSCCEYQCDLNWTFEGETVCLPVHYSANESSMMDVQRGCWSQIWPAGTLPNNVVTPGGFSRENRCCTLGELLDLVQLLC